MMMAVECSASDSFDALPVERLAKLLLQIARHVLPRTLRKHPRGPKPSKEKGYVDGAVARRHVFIARVLKDGIANSGL